VGYQAGHTLVELAVAMVVAGVLAGQAMPAFRDLLLQARMADAANALVHGVHLARQQALLRGTEVVMCRSTDGQQCRHAGGWSTGFLVFANHDGDSPPRVDPDEPVLQVGAPYPGGEIRANRGFFVLRPPGRRSVNGTLWLCDQRGDAAARVVVVSYSGRPRTAPATDSPSAVSCPA
jgi:type IV fimbrial biogenesis protein FimT